MKCDKSGVFSRGSCSAISASFLFLNNQYAGIAAAINVKPQFVANAGSNQFRQLQTGGLPHCSQGRIIKNSADCDGIFLSIQSQCKRLKIFFFLDSLGRRELWPEIF